MSPRWASRRSGSRLSTSRRWRISAMTSPITARSTRSSARWRTSTASSPRRMRSAQGHHRPGAQPHLRSARLVPREPPEPRQSEVRLVRVGGRARRRHAAQQLAVDLRRRRLDLGTAARPVLPAQFPQEPAGPELPQSRGAARVARQHALLAGSRRRWPAARCDQFLLSRRAAARQPAAAETRRARRAASTPRIPTATNGTATTTRSRRCCPSSRRSARLLDGVSGRGGARRDLLRRFHRHGGRIHAARPAAHGLQLRAAEQRQLAAAHPRNRRDSCGSARRRAGRAGRSPTTTWNAWSAAGAGAIRLRTPRPNCPRWSARCAARCAYSRARSWAWAKPSVPYEALRDPYGIAFWPTFKGRDGCRTPMPWDSNERGGFSSGEPWLPVPHAASARCRWPRRSATPRRHCMAFGACSRGAAIRSC